MSKHYVQPGAKHHTLPVQTLVSCPNTRGYTLPPCLFRHPSLPNLRANAVLSRSVVKDSVPFAKPDYFVYIADFSTPKTPMCPLCDFIVTVITCQVVHHTGEIDKKPPHPLWVGGFKRPA